MRVRNQRLTVILVPQGGARTYTFQARLDLLLAATGLLVVLVLTTIAFMFSYGRLFAASRHNASLESEVKDLRQQLTQVAELRQRLAEAEETRARVLTILAARGERLAGASALEATTTPAALAVDEIQVRGEDFVRTYPRAWPVQGRVTREYLGAGKDARAFHPGIDIAAATGTPVRAAAAGSVTYAGWDPEYGYLVILEHGLGLETRYGHNSRLAISAGDRVDRGQLIAGVGSTGRSTAPHLHFEIRKDGLPIDPRTYLD